MSRTWVYQCFEIYYRGQKWGGDWKKKSVGFERSRRIEENLPCSTVRINTAHASSAGVLLYLVLGWVFTALPLAFAEEEEVCGHSLTVCPTPPQKRRKLFANWHARSAAVSLPSFPILLFRNNVFLSVFWDDDLESCGTNSCFWCLFWLLFRFEEEEDCLILWFFNFLWRLTTLFSLSLLFSFLITTVNLLS